jgi:hypothetical protein
LNHLWMIGIITHPDPLQPGQIPVPLHLGHFG